MISHDKSSKMDQKVPAESVKIWVFFGQHVTAKELQHVVGVLLLIILSCSSDS